VGSALFWLSANVTGRSSVDGRREATHPIHLPLGCGEVLAERAGGGQLEHTGAEVTEHSAYPEQLVFRRERARHGLAVDGAVSEGAAGGEAKGAGLDALSHDGGHGLDVVGRRRLVARAALAHHVAPNGPVGHLCAEVHNVLATVERVEELREALPAPGDARREGGAGDVLHALHEADEPLVAIRGHRCEAHAAVAHHHRGHAVPARGPVPARGRELLVPGGLAVVVRVDVDEARRDEGPVGVDLARARAIDPADGSDDTVSDGDVRGAGRRTGAVDDRATADHQVVCAHRPPGLDRCGRQHLRRGLTPRQAR